MMPRQARIKAENAIYHIMQRGNEKKPIFKGGADKYCYLEKLQIAKQKFKFKIHAYCLMNNHVHLLVSANGADISEFMKSINVSYVAYFNHQYQRCGHLFQGRFISEIVDTDRYFLQASKYIHANPVKALMVEKPQDYHWSSYGVYIGTRKDELQLVDIDLVLDIISKDRKVAIEKYKEWVTDERRIGSGYRRFRYFEEGKEDERIQQAIIRNILTTYPGERDQVLLELRKKTDLTLKEMGQLVGGLSASAVQRALKKQENK